MTDYTCPAEGCDYGEKGGKSLAAVRSHINASSDGAHDWEQLKPTVEQQGDQQPEATEETVDQETSSDDQTETPDGPDTDDEYQQQVEANTAPADDDEDDDKSVSVDPVDDTADDTGGSATVTLVTASVALALVVLLVRGNDKSNETTAQDPDDGDDTADAFEGWDDE
ncbi:hypothetical protein GJ631_14830 [Natronomonas sp. CBA1123]|uniref:hypothetical protein n=1 Tax=Natronomonas sp. CBA1123 TaxID=2668070 RepID=UPI0012EA3C92|nr:hypothetical protein [Natronomonas sp. CBA1123]MUV87790.1 hypothetical protein [Natronomonas sp. CBA1123]